MPEPCLCGAPACSNCFPASYRQARAWERDQATKDRMTSTEQLIRTSVVIGAEPPAAPVQDQDIPEERKCGKHWCHDWGTGMVIIGVVRCARCGKLSTLADFRSDLWDKPGDHERDMAGCEEEDLLMDRGRA